MMPPRLRRGIACLAIFMNGACFGKLGTLSNLVVAAVVAVFEVILAKGEENG